MEELASRRALNQGFGDALNRAVVIVVSPLIFGALGLLLDHFLGWTPVLTIAGAAYGFFGAMLRMYYAYNAQMKSHEADMPRARADAAPVVNRAAR